MGANATGAISGWWWSSVSRGFVRSLSTSTTASSSSHRLARTPDSWREELLARFTIADMSNGAPEAINLLYQEGEAGRPRLSELHQLPAATLPRLTASAAAKAGPHVTATHPRLPLVMRRTRERDRR